VGIIPFIAVSWATGQWGFCIGAVLACIGYYAAYEYMHWCMHLPKRRNVERTGIFFRLNGHHLLHHRYMHQNFNVVLPLADLCLGTLLLRSKIHFKQAEGPSVPNVQPKVKRAPVAVGV
jgi:sterol desaturase/sphingolipid hydroxylase (fatty acid hydroxylase superfamily)